jgi:hypothetical protein
LAKAGATFKKTIEVNSVAAHTSMESFLQQGRKDEASGTQSR